MSSLPQKCNFFYINIADLSRAVARIFEWGGTACERSEQAADAARSAEFARGARGAEPPGKFLQKYRLKDHFLPIRKQEIETS